MNKILPRTLIVVLVCVLGVAQQKTLSNLKKNDRPVFLSAKDLAEDCRTFLTVLPDGKPFPNDDKPVNVSTDQIAAAIRCKFYIQGVNDGELEHVFGSHYHPVLAQLESMKPLIDTFLKYLADHPEEQDFAASTILNKAMHTVANAQTPVKKNQR
ncbi:MAG: hypothetical protein ABSD63_00735 [Candidatus Korobacteraceae bacterium]|jgi:hypothetical protein